MFIGEPKTLSSVKLIFENAVFFDKIVDDDLLVAVKPAGQGDHEKMQGLYDVRHCLNRLSAIFFDNNIIRFARVFAPYGTDLFGVPF